MEETDKIKENAPDDHDIVVVGNAGAVVAESIQKIVKPNENKWRIVYASGGLNMFFLGWACVLVNIASLGIAVPWTMTWYWNAWATRVRIDGKRVIFDGSPGGFFVVWIKVWILSILTLTIYYWIRGHSAKERYIDENIDWASNY